jgi:hypothetical protein
VQRKRRHHSCCVSDGCGTTAMASISTWAPEGSAAT